MDVLLGFKADTALKEHIIKPDETLLPDSKVMAEASVLDWCFRLRALEVGERKIWVAFGMAPPGEKVGEYNDNKLYGVSYRFRKYLRTYVVQAGPKQWSSQEIDRFIAVCEFLRQMRDEAAARRILLAEWYQPALQ